MFCPHQRPASSPDWPDPSAATAPRGCHYGPVGVSLKPLTGEKGGSRCSIRSSPPLLLPLWGSLTGLIIQGTCRADWQLNEPTIAGLLQAPFHGFSLCMTNPPTPPNIPCATSPKLPFSLSLSFFLFISTAEVCLTSVLSLLEWMRWDVAATIL